MSDPITPPVPEVIQVPAQVAGDLTLVQRFIQADKAQVMAALIHVAILLVTAVGLKLSAADTAIIGSIVAVGLSYFLAIHFKK